MISAITRVDNKAQSEIRLVLEKFLQSKEGVLNGEVAKQARKA